MIKKTVLSSAIVAALASMTGTTTLYAQNADQDDDMILEEVVVTGIRKSLVESMDIKRESVGVVDAVTAEDIGKFPNTNLA